VRGQFVPLVGLGLFHEGTQPAVWALGRLARSFSASWLRETYHEIRCFGEPQRNRNKLQEGFVKLQRFLKT
jgi:hypothetical protein